MKAIDVLVGRQSCPKLSEPKPTTSQLELMFKAAARAADHGLLQPWRFLIIEGERRRQFGELMRDFALESSPEMNAAAKENLVHKAFRAPLIVVAIASPKVSPKIPEVEQVWSAVAATQMLVTAAYAQGLGAIWRTGAVAFSDVMKQGLKLAEREQVVGFVYLGTPSVEKPLLPINTADFVNQW